MTKKNSTKRSLILSALSLLLCFSMLIGTTFAWFTDEVSSKNNIIKAGNLDVELEYKNYKDGKLADKWTSVQDQDLFDRNALWEPGRVEIVYLKVSNVGTLALKYQLNVNVYKEIAADNGEKLSDYLVFKVVDIAEAEVGTYTRDNVKDAADVMGLKEYNGNTTELKAGEEKYVALLVYMPETVGNDINYRGETVPTIELGVNLYATQLANEEDSFGKDYDEDAWHNSMKVYNAGDLQAAIDKGEDVVLMNDINAGSIEITDDVKINLDGNKLTANIAVAEDAVVVIANGNIVTANSNNSAIETVGNLTLDNVTVNSARHGVRVEGGKTVINGGTYTAAGYAGRTQHALNVSDGGQVIINGGTFIGPKGTASDSGSAVNVQAGSTVTINGGNFSGGKRSTLAVAGTLIVYGGTFDQDPSAYVATGFKAVANTDGTYSVIFPQESFNDLIENANPGEIVNVPAGNFTLSSNNDFVLVGSGEDTVITFTGSIENVNISNATISGEPRLAVKSGQTAVFKNVNFEGTKAWGSVQGVAEFIGCSFEGLLHIDSSAETTTIKFVDCTFGEYSIIKLGGNADYILKNCVVEKLAADATGAWGKEWLITYCDTTFTGCTLGRVIRAGKTIDIKLNDCVDAEGKAVTAGIVHKNSSPYVWIDGVPAVFSNDALKTVVDNGATKVMLYDGEYDLNGIQKDGLTLIGVGEDVKMANTTKYASGKATGAIWQAINLENMTLTNTVYTMADGSKATFTNVNFAAGFRQGYGTSVVFTDCTFGSNSEGYALHFQTDSASDGGVIKLNGCEFEGGKVHLGGKRAYEFVGCDFAEGTDFQAWSNVTLEGCTVNGVAITEENAATFFPNLNLANVTIK